MAKDTIMAKGDIRTKDAKRVSMDLSMLLSGKRILAIAAALIILTVIVYFRQSSDTTIGGTTTTTQPYTPPPTPSIPTTQPTTTTTAPTTSTGRLVVALKDEIQNIPGGAKAHQMEITVTGVDVHTEGDEGGEWIAVSGETKTLDLLQYTDNVAIVAEADIPEGAYDKVRLMLSDSGIWITSDIFYIFTPKRYDLVVPEQTTIDHTFNITSGETKTLILDFDVPRSVLRTGIEYSLDPAITVSEQSGIPDNAIEI